VPIHPGSIVRSWSARATAFGAEAYLQPSAVHAFAGADASRAVVEPEARAVLAAFDTHAEHVEAVHSTL
jgi:hypothetical protein